MERNLNTDVDYKTRNGPLKSKLSMPMNIRLNYDHGVNLNHFNSKSRSVNKIDGFPDPLNNTLEEKPKDNL